MCPLFPKATCIAGAWYGGKRADSLKLNIIIIFDNNNDNNSNNNTDNNTNDDDNNNNNNDCENIDFLCSDANTGLYPLKLIVTFILAYSQ